MDHGESRNLRLKFLCYQLRCIIFACWLAAQRRINKYKNVSICFSPPVLVAALVS